MHGRRTASRCSSSRKLARDSVDLSATALSASVSVGFTCLRASSAIAVMRAILAAAEARSSAFFASTSALARATWSGVIVAGPAIMRCRSP